eukprot:SAG31_NODE_540_length_14288_cov_51.958066_6_plen_75_part_00
MSLLDREEFQTRPQERQTTIYLALEDPTMYYRTSDDHLVLCPRPRSLEVEFAKARAVAEAILAEVEVVVGMEAR